MAPTERPVQSPCQWCGTAIMQSPTGRLRRYCDRSCQQRAYEIRTARQRLQADVDAGRVRTDPAVQIVERVVRSRHPHTAAGWEQALDELSAQLADGRLGPWHASRIRAALARVDAQLGTIPSGQQPAVPRPRTGADSRLHGQLVDRIRAAGGTVSTTLERLAADLQADVDVVRQVVLDLEHTAFVVARRRDNVVSVDELAVHARFELLSTAHR